MNLTNDQERMMYLIYDNERLYLIYQIIDIEKQATLYTFSKVLDKLDLMNHEANRL